MKYAWTLMLISLFGCDYKSDRTKELNRQKELTTVRSTYYLKTVVHDEHLFILSRYGHFIHHPDCPCQTNKVEQKEQTLSPPTVILDLIRNK